MQNLLGTTQSRLAQSLSLTHGLFHKVINIGGGGANTLRSLDKSPKNTLLSYKSAKPTKQLFHTLIARGFNESPKQSSLSVIARFGNAESKKSAQFVIARALPEAIHKIKSFCYFLLSQKVESPYPIDSNPQSKIPLIHSWLIYFSHCFKSFALDTSLRNATLSMTDFHNLSNTRNIRLCERVL